VQLSKTRNRAVSVIAAVFAALMLLLALPMSASADEVGEEYENQILGSVRITGEPVEGAIISVSGNGYSANVSSDAEGKWSIGVPEKGTYEVSIDRASIPDEAPISDFGPLTRQVEFELTNTVISNYYFGDAEREEISLASQFFTRLVYGINFGLMLGLASVGLSLVFGTTKLSNFAHAEMVTFGAVIALFLASFDINPFLGIILAVAASGAAGLAQDVFIWGPLRRKGLGIVQLMIVSIGLALTLRYVYQFFIGGGTQQLPSLGGESFKLFGTLTLSSTDIASMAISIVVLTTFALWLTLTKTGKATRAISDNIDLAAASGIDVDRVIRYVWIAASALAGLGGILWAYFRPGIKWDMGEKILLLIFAAVVLGGLGTAFGALIGALIVGIMVETSTMILAPDIKYVGALIVLIGVLLVKPTGLLGSKERIG
jgi:branched-chain amino acid transport system permease protein